MMLEDLDLAKLETQKDLVEGRFMYGATHSVDFEGCLTLLPCHVGHSAS